MLYTLMYVFVLDQSTVALINLSFTLAYCCTLGLNALHSTKASKVWFFSVLMVHLMVCTNVYVTNATGFHLYFFLVPTGAFLLFELKDKLEKISLSLVSVVLFLYCENTMNEAPLIELTESIEAMIYQSVFLVNMIEVIVVLTIFANQLERNQTKLTRQATKDSLTQTSNRHEFFEKGESLLLQSQQRQEAFSLVLLDFDYFKSINDQYGHAAGDTCLIMVSKIIQAELNSKQILARIGGEEFAIILPSMAQASAVNLAERIRCKIEQHAIPIIGESHFNCTVSLGVTCKSNAQDTLKTLLVHADNALYLAKNNGRNRVETFAQINA